MHNFQYQANVRALTLELFLHHPEFGHPASEIANKNSDPSSATLWPGLCFLGRLLLLLYAAPKEAPGLEGPTGERLDFKIELWRRFQYSKVQSDPELETQFSLIRQFRWLWSKLSDGVTVEGYSLPTLLNPSVPSLEQYLDRLSDASFLRVIGALFSEKESAFLAGLLEPEILGTIYEDLLELLGSQRVSANAKTLRRERIEKNIRRKTGTHYTTRSLTREIVAHTLRPRLEEIERDPKTAGLMTFKVCDPAMGCGAFLVECARQLATALLSCWRRTGSREAGRRNPMQFAIQTITRQCIYGIELDPQAAELARLSLWLLAPTSLENFHQLSARLRCADSLLGAAATTPPPIDTVVNERRSGYPTRNSPSAVVDWKGDFPEVFERERPGFDVVVANPPFIAGRDISRNFGSFYLRQLRKRFHPARGGADLAAYFFRLAYEIVRQKGVCGLIATRTISKGETVATGLGWICSHGGTLLRVDARVMWPGTANIHVSFVYLMKGSYEGPRILNKREVGHISPSFEDRPTLRAPVPLAANLGRCFQGVILNGMGFCFPITQDEEATKGSEEERILRDPHNSSRIRPYLGGDEVNSHPTHAPHRQVICFDDLNLEQANRWPELLRLVEKRVRLEREKKSAEVAKAPWWQFWRTRPELRAALAPRARAIVIARHQPFWCCTLVPTQAIFSEALVVVASDRFEDFAILQSRVHEVWAETYGSSLGDGIRYTPTRSFETFPFPNVGVQESELRQLGAAYFHYRSQLMIQKNVGMTALYRQFHDPNYNDDGISTLRDLSVKMDAAVFRSLGWSDEVRAKFVPLQRGLSGSANIALNWRYGWSLDFRSRIIKRLWELNNERSTGHA